MRRLPALCLASVLMPALLAAAPLMAEEAAVPGPTPAADPAPAPAAEPAPPAVAGPGEWELGVEGWQETRTDPQAADLRAVRQQIVDGDYGQAVKAVRKWLKLHPQHVLEADMRMAMGDAMTADGAYWDALYEYEFVARHFTATPCFFQALERERFLAEKFITGWKRRWLGMRLLPTRDEGVELLVRIQERVPGTPLAEESGKRLADWYFHEQNWIMAAEAFDVFLLTHPGSKWEPEARRRVIEANLARFESPRFDSTGLLEAKQRLVNLQRDFPAEAAKMDAPALLTRIDESLGERDLLNARWYSRRGESISAAVMYRRVIKEHPRTEAAAAARESLKLMGQPEVDQRDPQNQPPKPAAAAPPAQP